jgi:hypothetical protein
VVETEDCWSPSEAFNREVVEGASTQCSEGRYQQAQARAQAPRVQEIAA